MMATRPKPKFRPWKGVTREMRQLAEERTRYLLEQWPMDAQTLPIKLANAYLQGIADAAEAAQQRGETIDVTPIAHPSSG